MVGASISESDTLVILVDDELRLEELSARLVLEKVQSHLARSQQLLAGGGISAQALEALDFEVKAAQIQWRKVQMDLERMVVRATMAGVLAEVYVRTGERVSAGQVVCRIIDAESLKAVLFVATDQLGAWQDGGAAAVGAAGERVEGRVVLVSPLVDVASGTCQVVVEFPGAGKVFRPGMVVRVVLGESKR